MADEAASLTPKQEAFAQAYLETGSASEAYRRAYDAAGMSDQSVHREACRLLRHPKIAPRIDAERDALMVKHNITQNRVMSELARIAFANMADYITTTDDGSAYIDLSMLTPDQAAAVAEVTSEVYVEGKGEDAKQVKRTKLKLSDKRSALVDLARHLGSFEKDNAQAGKAAGDAAGKAIGESAKQLTDLQFARWLAFKLSQGANAAEAPASSPPTDPPET